jgi:hypothetical protein
LAFFVARGARSPQRFQERDEDRREVKTA